MNIDGKDFDDYVDLEINLVDDGNKQLHISTSKNSILVPLASVNADEIWLSLNGDNLDVYYKDLGGSKVNAGSLDLTLGLQEFARINYFDTAGDNIILNVVKKARENHSQY